MKEKKLDLREEVMIPEITFVGGSKYITKNTGKIVMILEHETEYIVKCGKGMYSRVKESELKNQ